MKTVDPLQFEISQNHIKKALKQIDHRLIQETLFIIPNNDGEARRAVQILLDLHVPHLLVSQQGWGARLENEKLEAYLKPAVKKIVIFEIPGPTVETQLRERGYEVIILDHHEYVDLGLDYTKPESSLEGLMNLISWPASRTDRAIAINDAGYIPGLRDNGFTPEEIRAVREFDLVAQGRSLRAVRDQVKAAQKLIPKLPKREGITMAIDVPVDETILKQEIALLSTDGRADTFEVRRDKVGFTGNPAAVRALLAYDYTRFGYAPGGFRPYGGGSESGSMFFGFKPTSLPAGSKERLPQTVIDGIFQIIINARKAHLQSPNVLRHEGL